MISREGVCRARDNGISRTVTDSGIEKRGVSFLAVSGNTLFASSGAHFLRKMERRSSSFVIAIDISSAAAVDMAGDEALLLTSRSPVNYDRQCNNHLGDGVI